MSMPVSVVGPGAAIPLRVDLLVVRHDRAIVLLIVTVAANDLTPTQERGTLSTIADRMRPAAI
jgi:hypothetical protein